MPRRRYKLFMVCAAVFCFMLYRVYLNSRIDHEADSLHWPATRPAGETAGETTGEDLSHAAEKVPPVNARPPIPEDDRWSDNQAKPAKGKGDEDALTSKPKEDDTPEKGSVESAKGSVESAKDPEEPLRWQDPPKEAGSLKPKPGDDDVTPTKIHWEKFPEHFPVPEASILTMPTGTAKKLPKIQYEFASESADAKSKREDRLERVKAEISRSWAGYKKFAWMHDELSPVSGKFRDPFCGWAATLVDSLDTLWIAGLKDEFKEAAKAVAKIDFTAPEKDHIPVFETTIRYLGGLLAAYDVSGGAKGSYPILLEKAVELAEILMSIFDTPNRMPVLYYSWRPETASQPRRASRVGIAELATLSMEFTRLAQLTGKQKYYDAIDRITNELVDLQTRGTSIPGLFPENLDASGCNRTATTPKDNLSLEAQAQVDHYDVVADPVGHVAGSKSSKSNSKKPPVNEDNRTQRRDTKAVSEKKPPFTAQGNTADSDCVPQGLVPSAGRESYHVGGSQDSAYEYFPKQYLLLGGLEEKYKKLHIDTVEAINEWLMFRPMIKGDWDILFPAKILTDGNPKKDMSATYEVAHLTCFVGGMYGLGGKIFGREKDVETAKKLTDGCVWAYQSTASGLMPEHAEVAPCPTIDKCEFNQTRWYDLLDTAKDIHDEQAAKWEAEHKGDTSKSTKNEAREKEDLSKQKAPVATPDPKSSTKPLQKRAAAVPPPVKPLVQGPTVEDEDDGSKLPTPEQDIKAAPAPAAPVKAPAAPVKAAPVKPLVQGPAIEDEDDGSKLPISLDDKTGKSSAEVKANAGSYSPKAPSLRVEASLDDYKEDQKKPETKTTKTDDSTKVDVPSVPKAQPPTIPQALPNGDRPTRTQPNAQKPMTHKEFVEDKIESMNLTAGYVSIFSPSYILRPEAIESVWYMYRITGDAEWMEKGWKMFEATIRATRTEYANSAIDNVMTANPSLKNEMESFWLAETLKYYYLLFSEPDVISLDEWVLNTEAHPFKRPTGTLVEV